MEASEHLTVSCEREQRGIELADIFRRYGHLLRRLSPAQHRVVRDIIQCRTKELGGHITEYKCDTCGYTDQSYNSCRNRHCPKCQGLEGIQWTRKRMKELLPVPYFHGVFTLPHIFNDLMLANRRVFYNLLFRAASETLQEEAQNPENLGADIGMIVVLHTWTQKLLLHAHVHCVIPGGGIAPDGKRWIASGEEFFMAVKKLSPVFRGKYLDHLEQAFHQGKLVFPGELEEYRQQWRFKQLLVRASRPEWVVYAKKPFAGPEQVLRYLSRYIQRIAISNRRILKVENDRVYFTWKDRNNNYEKKVASLEVTAFIKRFLLHIVPKGFVRIRYYGFLSNRHRAKKTVQIRAWLGVSGPADLDKGPSTETWQELLLRVMGIDVTRCPRCGTGKMQEITRIKLPRILYSLMQGPDTS